MGNASSSSSPPPGGWAKQKERQSATIESTSSTKTVSKTTAILPVLPEVITYRFGESMVYVTPAQEYEEAIDIALQEFPILKSIASEKTDSDWKDRIRFYTMSSVDGELQNICISRSAWKICTQRMSRGEVITIRVVHPEAVAADSLKMIDASTIGSPPQYLEIPKHSGKEKAKSSGLQGLMSRFSPR